MVLKKISIYVRGLGSGRDSAMRTILNKDVTVDLIADKTRIAHGGGETQKGEENIMARNLVSIVKQSRREGYALHPKAHKYMIKKTGIPGQHGAGGRRIGSRSQFAIQLRENKKLNGFMV